MKFFTENLTTMLRILGEDVTKALKPKADPELSNKEYVSSDSDRIGLYTTLPRNGENQTGPEMNFCRNDFDFNFRIVIPFKLRLWVPKT